MAMYEDYEDLVERLRGCIAEQNGGKTLWCQAADAVDDLVWICKYQANEIEELFDKDINVPRWIPVTERLPNGNGKYLVSGKDKVWVCEFMILGYVSGWCNSAMNPCVKYWMPLPEPPKDGE